MKGNLTSICGHLPTLWPYLPQEKHNTIDQSLRAVAGGGCGACISVPVSRRFNNASISVGAERGRVPVLAHPEAGISASLRDRLVPPKGRWQLRQLVPSARASARSPHTPAEPSLTLVWQLSSHQCQHGSPTLYICRRYLEWEYHAAHYRGAAAGHSSGDRQWTDHELDEF